MAHSPFPDPAAWIQSAICGGAKNGAPAPWFRKSFELSRQPTRATLLVTALGLVDAELNGHPVTEDQFVPGWTEYDIRVAYRSYDVTSLLLEGENILGCVLGDGWYCGHVAWCDRQLYGDRPKLKAALLLEFADGETRSIVTDASWKTAVGPIVANDLLMGESYDARLAFPGWSEPGFDDSAWTAPEVAPDPGIEICDPILPPVRRKETFPAKLIEEIPQRRTRRLLRYDFGQNLSGRLRLKVTAEPGTTLVLTHAEMLNPDGSLYLANLRKARATDVYTCRGGSEETWEPRFTFHGFRYASIEITGIAHSLEPEAVVLHTDLEPIGDFECSHPLLNQLFRNIRWGAKGNFLEIPTDCPQRDERLGWTGDAQVFVSTAAILMDVRTFFHKWLRDLRDSQGEDGVIPSVAPEAAMSSLAGNDGGPAWADAMILCPWAIYEAYGDLDILSDNYEAMVKFLRFISGPVSCKDGIRNHPDLGRHCFGDWLAKDGSPNQKGFSPPELIGTAFLAEDARLVAEIAKRLGRTEDAEEFDQLHRATVEAFRKRFVTPNGLVIGATQTSYLLALRFGLIPEAQRAGAVTELIRDIEKRKYHLSTGFVGTPHLLPVLEASGRLDVAYRLLEQETFPSWLFPVTLGATTMWEHWDSWTPDKGFQNPGMNSFNHYAYGAVGAWMVRSVAGLAPAEPGYRRIVFRPRPGGSITSAAASLKTAHGRVAIAWKLEGDSLSLALEVPEGTEAELDLPPGFTCEATRLAPGKQELIANRGSH